MKRIAPYLSVLSSIMIDVSDNQPVYEVVEDYKLLGKWLMSADYQNTMTYFHALQDKSDVVKCVNKGEYLYFFGMEVRLEMIYILYGMIEQLNAQEDLPIKIDLKKSIENYLTLTNTPIFVSNYKEGCMKVLDFIEFDGSNHKLASMIIDMQNIISIYPFLMSQEAQLLLDEAKTYFKRTDSNDTSNKTDRNSD